MSDDIDPVTGLPKELGVFDDIKKEDQEITVKITRKKFGKKYTLIEGINENEVDIDDLVKSLKKEFACGGTFKEGTIELQGDHRRGMTEALSDLGFDKRSINVE
jgi:translation initiation factor 1